MEKLCDVGFYAFRSDRGLCWICDTRLEYDEFLVRNPHDVGPHAYRDILADLTWEFFAVVKRSEDIVMFRWVNGSWHVNSSPCDPESYYC